MKRVVLIVLAFVLTVSSFAFKKGKRIPMRRSTMSIYGKVKGFLPSEFKIENIDAFGAALYRGQWRGVRFVKTR